jgi:hypothetical protein
VRRRRLPATRERDQQDGSIHSFEASSSSRVRVAIEVAAEEVAAEEGLNSPDRATVVT